MKDWKEQLQDIKKQMPKEEYHTLNNHKRKKKKNVNDEVKVIKKDDNELKWIDTHAHYNHGKFKSNQNKVLDNIKKDVEYVINLGTDVKSNKATLKMIKDYDFIYGMIGFFPTDVFALEDSDVNSEFIYQLNNQKIVGIGEIGLDFNWDCVNGPDGKILGDEARKLQEKWLRYQLNLAKKMNLPVSLHSRDAEEDTARIFKDYEEIKGVMHCFSYGVEAAKLYLEKGLYLGVGGTSTYKSNEDIRAAIKYAPLDRILLETDAPYLSPEAVRRSLNTSSNITYVIDNIANIKNVSREEVIRQTNLNAKKLFNLQ